MAFPTSMSGTPRAKSSNGVAAVDCQNQVRSWRLLRSLMELLIPSCNCSTFIEDQDIQQEENHYLQNCYNSRYPAFSTSSSPTIVGTIFGFRHGKVRLCIQTSYNSTNPVLLLELAVPTTTLAREMQEGILRIALESTATRQGLSTAANSCSLLSMPVWKMYCNGRKVGFAVKRQPSKADMEALRVMSTDHVVVGAGVISGKELLREDELMYLRANFERVCGSANSESFHLIDQDGSSNTGQELGIFFFRSR